MAGWWVTPGTGWTLSELRSSFQKFVRRRDPRTITVADALLEAGGQFRTALLRRLAIISAEEGTLGVVPAATDVALGAGGSPDVVNELARLVVRAMLATARDKDPVHLLELVQLHGAEGLKGVEREAWEALSSWSIPRARALLVECEATVRTPLVHDIISALRRRAAARMGDGEWPMFVGIALALRARERSGVEPIVLPVGITEPAAAGPLDTLPWWSLDPHVAIGRTVLREALAWWPGVSFDRGFAIWFQLASDILEGYVPREGWRERHRAASISEPERQWWSTVEPFVRTRLEELIARRVAARPALADSRTVMPEISSSAAGQSVDGFGHRMAELRDVLRHAGVR